MASSITLLTKRTIGASSTSARSTPSSVASSSEGDLEAVELEVLARQLGHGGVHLLERLREQLAELVLLDHDRLDREAGGELDLVEGVEVGGVGDGDEQTLAALDERQHAVPAQGLFADQPDDLEVGLDGIEVEQRCAELLRGGDGDLAGVGEVVLDEVADDGDAALAGAGQGLEHGGVGHEAVGDQPLGQALKARSI
jgi:hypothetical protein